MKNKINEGLPSAIPTYPVDIAGRNLTLRFDVNINKTKKGIKLQFVLPEVPEDPRKLQDLTNEIGTELQERFGSAGLQIIYDVENPYKNVVGFLIPLPSVAEHIVNDVLKVDSGEEEEKLPAKEEPPAEEELPDEEVPAEEPEDQTIKEILKARAGIK